MHPFAPVKADHKDQAAGKEFGGHSQPHANQPQSASQQQGQGNTHPPHGGKADKEGPSGVSGAPQGTGRHNGSPEQGFREGYNPQYLAAQVDDLGIGREDPDELGSEEIEHRPAEGHNDDTHPADHSGKPPCQVFPASADGLPHQGGACYRNTGSGQVADGLGGHRQMISCHGHGADAGNYRGDDNLSHAQGGTFQGHRQSQFPGGGQAVALKGIPLFPMDLDGGFFSEKHDQEHTGYKGRGQSRGKGRPAHAPSSAPHKDFPAKQGDGAGRVDKQGVENHIEHIDDQVENHRGAGIPGAADHGAEHVGDQGEGHSAGDDPEIEGCIGSDGGIGVQHGGEKEGQTKGHGAHKNPEDPYELKGLPGNFLSILLASGPQMLGHLDGKSHSGRVEESVKEPGGAGCQAHRGGGVRSQGAHHSGVHILDQGEHDLFHNGWPCQKQHRGQSGSQMR